MTKLSTILQHQLSIICDLCKHHTLLEVANLIAVVGGDTTAHEVDQRARCHNCGVKGNNTYQIVYCGGSYDALLGAARTRHNACRSHRTARHSLGGCCWQVRIRLQPTKAI